MCFRITSEWDGRKENQPSVHGNTFLYATAFLYATSVKK